MTKQQLVMQREHVRLQRLVADPSVQQGAIALAQEAGVPIPPGVNPAVYVLTELYKADPDAALGVINTTITEQERQYGPISDADVAKVVAAQQPGAIDWGREFPDSKVLKAWQDLPAHSRLRETAKSPQFEALARQTFAKAGVVPFRGMTEGETFAALLSYAGKTKALSGGDRAAYDSLARHLGGVLGDGEAIRSQVEMVRQIHHDDHVLNRVAEKTRAEEAEAAKYRPKPPEQPTFDKKRIPQSALTPKEKPRDTTRDEVKHQFDRLKRQWELPDKQLRPEPLRMTIRNKLQLDAAMALCKAKGEPYSRAFASIDPAYRKELVGHLRDNGLEPAAASRSSGNSSERHWVPARSNTSAGDSYSGESYPSGGYSGGGYSGGGSGDATSEAPAAAGGGQP